MITCFFSSFHIRRNLFLSGTLLTSALHAQSPTDGVQVLTGAVTFSINLTANAWQFIVCTDQSLQAIVYQSSQNSSSSQTVNGVFNTAGITYYWGYRTSFNSWDAYQGGYSFITSSSALAVPTLVEPAHNTAGYVPTTIQLTWGPVSGITNYGIQVSETGSFVSSPVLSSTTTSYSHPVTTCKEYWWRVRSQQNLSYSAWSVSRRFYTQTAAQTLNLDVLLQGPFNTSLLVMNEGTVQLNQPYVPPAFTGVWNGSASVTQSFLNGLTGNDRIVDWVLVELRHPTTNVALYKHALLVQKDGDVVTPTGAVPSLIFPMRNCKIAVRHRNHLGAMTFSTFDACAGPVNVDLISTTTQFFGTEACALVATGRYALWAGDVNGDGSIKYTGSSNDRDLILTRVGNTTPNNTVSGYYPEDVNLSATVKYTGSQNDRDPILLNIGSTTPNNVRLQQLP